MNSSFHISLDSFFGSGLPTLGYTFEGMLYLGLVWKTVHQRLVDTFPKALWLVHYLLVRVIGGIVSRISARIAITIFTFIDVDEPRFLICEQLFLIFPQEILKEIVRSSNSFQEFEKIKFRIELFLCCFQRLESPGGPSAAAPGKGAAQDGEESICHHLPATDFNGLVIIGKLLHVILEFALRSVVLPFVIVMMSIVKFTFN